MHFNAVAMECDQHDPTKNVQKIAILEANGFKCKMVLRNCMCKNVKFNGHSKPEDSLKERRKESN